MSPLNRRSASSPCPLPRRPGRPRRCAVRSLVRAGRKPGRRGACGAPQGHAAARWRRPHQSHRPPGGGYRLGGSGPGAQGLRARPCDAAVPGQRKTPGLCIAPGSCPPALCRRRLPSEGGGPAWRTHQSSGALPTHTIDCPSLMWPQCGSSIEVSWPSSRTQIRPQRPCLPGQSPVSRAASPSATACS